jgi:hypothetical protein
MNKLLLRAGILVAATSAVFALSTSAASAKSDPQRALPTGAALYAVNDDDGQPPSQLFSIDSSDASATTIGTGNQINDSTEATQPAWDAATSTAYYIAWGVEDADALATVDLTSGVSTKVADFSIGGVAVDSEGSDTTMETIAIDKAGHAYAIVQTGGTYGLFSVNLGTGVLTLIGATSNPYDSSSNQPGFAYDPKTDGFYAVDSDGRFATVNVATGAQTEFAQVTLDGGISISSLQIDANGIFWVENDGEDADLWSIDPSAPASSAIFSGTIATTDGDFYTNALLLIPGSVTAPPATTTTPTATSSGPSLAFTGGINGTTDVILGSIAGGIVILGGILFFVGRRKRNSN